MPKMKEEELKRIIHHELENSIGFGDSDVIDRRDEAMKRYLGKPNNKEVEGKSQVVSRDLLETVEWIMSDLLNIFASSDDFVKFEPHGEHDEEQANQETDYTNYVFRTDNPGFLIMHDWFKDALLKINGYVKAWWEESDKDDQDSYENQTEEQITKLFMDDPDLVPISIELVDKTVIQQQEVPGTEMQGAPPGVAPPADPNAPVEATPGPPGVPALMPAPTQTTLYNITVEHRGKLGRVRVEGLPTKEVFVSKDTRSVNVDKSPFVAHVRQRTMSSLLEDGHSKAKLEKIRGGSLGFERFEEGPITGFAIPDDDHEGRWQDLPFADKSRKKIWFAECYVLADWDGDGRSELRCVHLAGDTILENYDADRNIIHSLCPVLLTHQHAGLSMYDLVKDIEAIRTQILRQILDSIYFSNAPQTFVQTNSVNLDDMLTRRPNGVVRTNRPPSECIFQPPPQELATATFPLLDMLDNVRESRTGVSRAMEALDPTVLEQARVGTVSQLLDRAHARVEMIARIFAETGIKSLFSHIHELTRKHQDQQRVVRLRDKWVTVNPAEWKERANMVTNVGLGTGSRDQITGNLAQVREAQTALAEFGLIGPQHAYNTAEKVVNNAGFKDMSLFAFRPEEAAAQQSQEGEEGDPMVALAKQEQDREDMKAQMEAQMEQQKLQFDKQCEQMKYQIEIAKLKAEQQEALAQMQLDRAEKDAAVRQKDEELRLKNLEIMQETLQVMTQIEAQNRIDVPGSAITSKPQQQQQQTKPQPQQPSNP